MRGKFLREKMLFQDNLSRALIYKLYLTRTFVIDGEDFLKKKNKGLKIGAINSFNGFLLKLPMDPNLERYNFVVI